MKIIIEKHYYELFFSKRQQTFEIKQQLLKASSGLLMPATQ
jgi:hypothetical protein